MNTEIALLSRLFHDHDRPLLDLWVDRLRKEAFEGNEKVPGALLPLLQHHMAQTLIALEPLLCQQTEDPLQPFDLDLQAPLIPALQALVAEQIRAGFKPSQTAYSILALKHILSESLIAEAARDPSGFKRAFFRVEKVLDRLAIFTFEAFVQTRERIISEQSLSLIELSTPVLLLWHQVLLLPLVGVIDTARTRQLTERLLETIARHEAQVTIIDVAGVPVLDTSVARHLMKTIDAARLLGTRVVMTGISPEGAQTLTKLGIGFSDVISRASLRSGIAEALMLVGRRVAFIRDVTETRS
jgi:rsbT co-antagonist protein RsbR